MELQTLKNILGPEGVITNKDIHGGYTTDWTGRYVGSTPAVLFPKDTAQVSQVLQWCFANSVAVIPQGGNTGMVGGATPLNGELILSLKKMTNIEETDGVSGQLVTEAGVTLGDVQQAAIKLGWKYGVDLSARDSASIGGTIATNAGGSQVLRYGNTRRQVLGLEAVTGTGEVVGDLRGLAKDNTGYHLPGLLCGSEGTLAVVTRARLRLVNAPEEEISILLGFESLREALRVVEVVKKDLYDVQACEIFFRNGLSLVCDQFGLTPPWSTPSNVYLLVDAAGQSGLVDRISQSPLAGFLESSKYVAFGSDAVSRKRIWRYRELHTEAISATGVPHKLDVTIPHGRLADFYDNIEAVVRSIDNDAQLFLFGHAGDGNIHVNILGPEPEDLTVDKVVLEFVASIGGSISAEHGIGRAKASYLHFNRTDSEIELFRRVKVAFDPAGILNPGAIFNK